jgi:predicted alpha/beta-hydrolase family hydrolase
LKTELHDGLQCIPLGAGIAPAGASARWRGGNRRDERRSSTPARLRVPAFSGGARLRTVVSVQFNETLPSRRYAPVNTARRLTLEVNETLHVSALLQLPSTASACFVLAHGAGAGMEHASMAVVAEELAARSIATLRFQFPYMERRSRRPDAPPLCHATVRAAVAAAARLAPGLPLFAGGRSFGGRMTSQAQAIAPLPRVMGLAFLGFPLHPAGKPSTERAAHLREVKLPMLFLQGTRDELAKLELLQPVVGALGALATLKLLQDADHSFHVPARTGRTDAEVRAEMLDALAAWIERAPAVT